MSDHKLQLSFLKEYGLLPSHNLLDFGCGPSRAGVFFVDYLDVGNYYGCDHQYSIINIAKQRIIDAQLMDKFPNFYVVKDFVLSDLDIKFDFIWLCSVFTHLSLDRTRECISKLLPLLKNSGIFFATIKTYSKYLENNTNSQSRYEILDIKYPFDYFEIAISDVAKVILLQKEETKSFFVQKVVQIERL